MNLVQAMKVLELVKDIMDIMALLAKFNSKQRLTVLGAVCALMIGLNQYPQSPQAAPGPADKQEDLLAMFVAAGGILPNGYNPAAIVRDPFAMPAQFQPQSPQTAPITGAGRSQQDGNVRVTLPEVQGIVGAGAAKVAILAVGPDSRSYRTGEKAGAYVITAISNNSVTLRGPEGTVVVPLGR